MKRDPREPLPPPDMPRRVFMASIAGGLLAGPCVAGAQDAGRTYTIGVVSIGTDPAQLGPWQSFIDAMRERGYVEGRNLVVKRAFGNPDRLVGMLAELVAARVDAIVTTGPRETRTAQRATATIPIVMTFVEDPVAEGFVKSLAQPGTNVTGLTSLVPGLSQKYVELLNEALPTARRFGVVATRAAGPESRHELETAVKARGLTLSFLVVSRPAEFDPTLARAKRDGVTGIIAPVDGVTLLHRRALVEAALKHRLPGIYWAREYVEAGGLMTYGASLADRRRHAAIYVDKILRGATPADLPIEQPTKFELVINLKTAKALGLTIPPSLLVRADQVIE
ncbi:MAG TPA: ABC transporter substrate-binding protein [Candidatus Dormibacteraeota bacterium]|nr:ABC transporter substrate-binding protein [Candidatus Dormibacteraeota bacterium]